MIDFRENEHILFEIRKHWFIIATELTILFLLAVIPILIPTILQYLNIEVIFSESGNFWPVFMFFYSFWLLGLWILGFVFWTNYYLDVWIVTNQKVVDVEQRGLFKREISMLHLDRIQDITVEINGVVNTFLKFGDLHVQTAGQQREFLIHDVSDPNSVGEKLNEVLMRFKDGPIDHKKEF